MPGPLSSRRWVAVVIATLVAATACSSSSHPAATPTTTSPSTASPGATTPTSASSPSVTSPIVLPPVAAANWKKCDGSDGPGDDQCATMQVPLDYANPGGPKIGIALARKPATGTKIGSLLENPGGPGASGVDELDYIASLLSPAVLAKFDIVGFDPRGVARSSPVRCESGPQLDQFVHVNPAPTDAAGFQALLAADKAFVQGCQARSGSILPFVGTINAARDMDEIRSAVGDTKLTYFGFSYGTFLGATYADQFPTHIRAMVLDGALDPALDPVTSNIEQAAGFDKELTAFFAYCSTTASCPWTPGGDLHTAYDSIMASIAAHPLPASGTNRTVGPGEAFFGVAQALYDNSTWPALAFALAAARSGDGSQLLQLSDEYTMRGANGVYANGLESNNAISCLDAPWPRDPTVLEQDAVRAKQKAPDFGVADLYGALPCTDWPATATSQPHRITADASPPIVVVGSTGDPATPYSDAQALAGELKHGVLLTRVGDGHTGYRSSGCIRAIVDAYLANLTVPAPGISCPSP